MRNKIKEPLREGLKSPRDEFVFVSKKYLLGLLKNTSNKSAKKYLTTWSERGGDKVPMTEKEYAILNKIKNGNFGANKFHGKN